MTWIIVPFTGCHDIYADTCDVCGTVCYPPFDVEDDSKSGPNWLCCSQTCAHPGRDHRRATEMTWRIQTVDNGRSAPHVRKCDLCGEEKPITHAVTESTIEGNVGMWDWTVCSQACAERAQVQAAIIGEPPWA